MGLHGTREAIVSLAWVFAVIIFCDRPGNMKGTKKAVCKASTQAHNVNVYLSIYLYHACIETKVFLSFPATDINA